MNTTLKVLNVMAVAFALVCTSGCLSKKLVVFEKNKLDAKAMKPFLGNYEVKEWISEDGPKSVLVTAEDGKHYFAYTTPERNYKLDFVVSKIPNSKQDLHVFSVPKQEASSDHLFFIVQAKKGFARFWVVFGNTPVSKGRLEFPDGRANDVDVKKFLSEHADEFVKTNKPSAILRQKKKSGAKKSGAKKSGAKKTGAKKSGAKKA
jgi:hypothetical protein